VTSSSTDVKASADPEKNAVRKLLTAKQQCQTDKLVYYFIEQDDNCVMQKGDNAYEDHQWKWNSNRSNKSINGLLPMNLDI
jgi:hypothetical protein